MTQALATFAIAILLLMPLRAHAELRCESLFESRDEATTALKAAINELEVERIQARTREWSADQIEEIRLKGRLEFDAEARAIKYYRGLIGWKIRELTTAVEVMLENETITRLKSSWPDKVTIDGTAVLLFTNRYDFLKAHSLSVDVMKVSDPHPAQIATVMVVMSRVRALKRTSWADAGNFEHSSLELLHRVFDAVSPRQLQNISENSIIKFRDVECCGTGNCADCTHPNVVFRDMTRWHGPTHLEVSPESTLPLYRTMDRLRAHFPDERWGAGFWDARVEFETGRLSHVRRQE